MLTEFVSLQFDRRELMEIHAALLQRAMLEDKLRGERGQERVDRRPLLDRIEALLGEREDRLHELEKELDEELWEHAWFSFTDEWAWFRARQELTTELGKDKASKTEVREFEKQVEARYHRNFDRYVAEVDMLDEKKKPKRQVKQPKD